jgi:hypothetical protein
VAIDVEMVIPPDDPSEPCYEIDGKLVLKKLQRKFMTSANGKGGKTNGDS